MRKKGQESGGPAATLVAIIAGLILLYFLFLPPDARQLLLEGNVTGNRTTSSTSAGILILENIGTLDYLSEKEIIHDLPAVTLYTKTESSQIKKVDSMYVKNSMFSKKEGTVQLGIADLDHTNNLLLSFSASDNRGNLIITLNGAEIFNQPIEQVQAPVVLPKELLQTDNAVVFSASSVGWRFWEKNYFQLKGIAVFAEVTDISNSESKNVFIVSSTEKNNLEDVSLRFSPQCREQEVSSLQIFINEYQVYDAIPDCGVLNPSVSILPRYILSGQNQVVFKTAGGTYTLDTVKVKSKLKQLTYPVYYFTLTDDQYYDIKDNKLDVNLTMQFVDDLEYKQAKLVVNGIETNIDQKARVYSRLLDSFVKKGNNAIEIIPQTRLDIVELRVELI